MGGNRRPFFYWGLGEGWDIWDIREAYCKSAEKKVLKHGGARRGFTE